MEQSNNRLTASERSASGFHLRWQERAVVRFVACLAVVLVTLPLYAQTWEWQPARKSPLTLSVAPNFTMSHIPLTYARGLNHDFGFEVSMTCRRLYASFNNSFTKSYFTYRGGALGCAFVLGNEEEGIIFSPNVGVGTTKVEIPEMAGWFRHDYWMVGPGVDFRFFTDKNVVMGISYRYYFVPEEFKSSVNTISLTLGYRFVKRKKPQPQAQPGFRPEQAPTRRQTYHYTP